MITSHKKVVWLTTANSDDIIIVIIVYLNDLRGQQASSASFILRAALTVNKTIPVVCCLHQFLTLEYGPEEEWGDRCEPVRHKQVLYNWRHTDHILWIGHDVSNPI